MTNERLLAIRVKRARLLQRAASERELLAAELRQLARPIELVDRAIAAYYVVKSHPALVAAIMVVLALLRPRGAFRWARRGWALWQSFRWLTKKAAA
jgi:hypothetical protein